MRMRPLSIFGAIVAGILLCLGASGAALAQDGSQDGGSNPPDRVAQLSDAEGSVSLEPAGTSSWTSAALNRPLTSGDRLWTDQNSRAELDIGDAVIRLGSTTGFSFLNLDDQTAQMQVTAGTVIVHVRSLSSGEQDEIDTPNLAVTLEQPGTYRVEVSDTGDTTIVKVDEGAALATGGGQSFPVAAQQSVTFTGTSVLTADYVTLGAPDDLDDWSLQRDQQEQQQASVAQQYVAPDTVGGDDLGSYGTWEDTPDWGYAWFPAVAAGWAPYTLGSWVWVSPWGWTWVDEEPWGFAPFHYGRWGYWNQRWCWIPAPRRKHPIYAPALVAWVGGSRGGGAASMGGRVGWFPLGPGDVYVPGYRASAGYVRNINVANTRITNTTYITNVYEGRAGNVRYVNSGIPGAVTAVPRTVFTSAQPVAPHRVILPHRGAIGLQATTAAPAITPVRQSVLGASTGRVVRLPPRGLMNRPVVARLTPPRAPVAFTREQAAVRANGGRPLAVTDLARLRPNVPAAPVRLATPMSVRERVLQQPSLPPARATRNDRPPWAQSRTIRYGTSTQRPQPETTAPQQRQPALEWRVPPRQEVVPQRQAAPERQPPAQRLVPQPRQMPEQHFASPGRQIEQPGFTPPGRQIEQPGFTPPGRQIEQPGFTPPPRQMQQPHFAPPPPPRAAPAPARSAEPRPAERRPPR